MDTNNILSYVNDSQFCGRIQYYLVKNALIVANGEPSSAERGVIIKVLSNSLDMRVIAFMILGDPPVAELADPLLVSDNVLSGSVSTVWGMGLSLLGG